MEENEHPHIQERSAKSYLRSLLWLAIIYFIYLILWLAIMYLYSVLWIYKQ